MVCFGPSNMRMFPRRRFFSQDAVVPPSCCTLRQNIIYVWSAHDEGACRHTSCHPQPSGKMCELAGEDDLAKHAHALERLQSPGDSFRPWKLSPLSWGPPSSKQKTLAREKRHKAKLLGSRHLSVEWGLPHEGARAKKFGMSSTPRESKHVGGISLENRWDIPEIWGAPKSLRTRSCVQSLAPKSLALKFKYYLPTMFLCQSCLGQFGGHIFCIDAQVASDFRFQPLANWAGCDSNHCNLGCDVYSTLQPENITYIKVCYQK